MYKADIVCVLLLLVLIPPSHTKRPGLGATPPPAPSAKPHSPPIITIIEKEPPEHDFLQEPKPPSLYQNAISIYHDPVGSWWQLFHTGVDTTRVIWRVVSDPVDLNAKWKDHVTREWPIVKFIAALGLSGIVVAGSYFLWMYSAQYYSGRLVSRRR